MFSAAFLGPTLVLREFKVDRQQEEVIIEGRASGLIGWLLVMLRIGATTRLKINASEISITSRSLSGLSNSQAPLTSIASTHCGFTRPIVLLVLAILATLYGAMALLEATFGGRGSAQMAWMSVASLVVAGMFFLAYAFLKKMYFYVQTHGGMVLGVKFTRSLIENVAVDIDRTTEAIDVINDLLTASQLRQ